MSDNNADCTKCVVCKNLGVELRCSESLDGQCDTESLQSKCQSWLEKCTISSDGESIAGSDSSNVNDSSASENSSDDVSNALEEFHGAPAPTQYQQNDNMVHEAFNQPLAYGAVRISNSQHVQLGNVTNIYGPVYITQAFSTVNQQSVTNQLFIDLPAPNKYGELSIICRKNWHALAPIQERQLLDSPAKFVIICHTVSEPYDNTQAANAKLVNTIQRFHMTKKGFDDIGYNFSIGSDGNVYEGRGWSVVGAHTRRYNRFSVAISFMGYFSEKLPSDEALKQAKLLIQRGVELGAIAEDYKLLAHCQCIEVESPGDMLLWEVQKWDRYDCRIDVQHPSPLVK